MIDLVEGVKALLVENGFDAHVKRLDAFTGKEGVCVRRLPSSAAAKYMNRKRCVGYLYQVVVRRRSEREAMEECEDIARILESARVESANGSYGFTSQEVYTEPQELEIDEAGFYAWHVRMIASIEI